MKLFKTLLFLVVCTTTISSCEPETLEENNTMHVQAHKNYKDLIDDKKDIDEIREAIPISTDSILVD